MRRPEPMAPGVLLWCLARVHIGRVASWVEYFSARWCNGVGILAAEQSPTTSIFSVRWRRRSQDRLLQEMKEHGRPVALGVRRLQPRQRR